MGWRGDRLLRCYTATLATHDSIFDPLHRLVEANYSGGAYYHYTYDQANRLKEVKDLSGNTLAIYTYSGLGDRLTENNTQFVLDLNAGLTQVLQDETYTYLYGSERLMQQSQASTGYFLGDALGSVRQLVDANGSVTLTKSYEPYGELVSSSGLSATTAYGYTGEWESQGLIYLRARTYSLKSPSYALEGYPPGDQKRLPNSDNPPIFKHTLGLAVDLGEPGKCINDPNTLWDLRIDDIARQYNLARPYHNLKIDYANMIIDEWWHFERP